MVDALRSQERMLIILKPDAASEAEARAIFEKWELDFAIIQADHDGPFGSEDG